MAAASLVHRRRTADAAAQLEVVRRVLPLVAVRHAAFAVVLAAGAASMMLHGWGLGHARWLALKLGLVAFLVLPLEAMHAWTWYGWIARGLRETPHPPFSRLLERGLGVDEMLRTLSVPLLGLGLPLLIWLSMARPR